MNTKNLGRGLSALLGEDETVEQVPVTGDAVNTILLSDLEPSPFQPRRVFDEDAINDLVDSIKTKGVLQPLLVRKKKDASGKYEIIGGERRWRASQKAGLNEVPVLVKDFSDKEALEVALIENLQRQDLNPLEEAEGYKRLMEEFANTQEDLAKAVGKSRSHVANTMRLLSLPEKVKDFLEKGKLTSGHARALLTAKDPEVLADMVISKGLNVRQTEKLAQEPSQKKKISAPSTKSEKQQECETLAEDLSRVLGLSVSIKPRSKGGDLILSYETLEQLDDLIRRLSQKRENVKQTTPGNDENLIQIDVEEDEIVFTNEFQTALEDENIISLETIEN